jgi:uncharacterized protein YggT (Ycf19 family)
MNMTYEREEVVTETEHPATDRPVERTTDGHAHSHSQTTIRRGPGPLAMVERLIVFLFGLVQALLVMRIILLLLAAREQNPIVQFVYDLSEIFVAPFRGMFAIDTVPAGQAALDVAAIVALIGWTIVQLLIIALIRIFRPATTA